MEKELQGKLVEILSSIQAATGKASDFAMEQLPDIAQSYVAYGRVSSSLFALAAIAAAAASFHIAYNKGFNDKAATHQDGCQKGDWHDSRIAFTIIGSVCFLFAFLVCVPVINEALLVWLAPKVWLLKELAQLVK